MFILSNSPEYSVFIFIPDLPSIKDLFISLIPISDEFAQNFSDLWGVSRVPSIYDALADYFGCYTGCLFYFLTNKVYNG